MMLRLWPTPWDWSWHSEILAAGPEIGAADHRCTAGIDRAAAQGIPTGCRIPPPVGGDAGNQGFHINPSAAPVELVDDAAIVEHGFRRRDDERITGGVGLDRGDRVAGERAAGADVGAAGAGAYRSRGISRFARQQGARVMGHPGRFGVLQIDHVALPAGPGTSRLAKLTPAAILEGLSERTRGIGSRIGDDLDTLAAVSRLR